MKAKGPKEDSQKSAKVTSVWGRRTLVFIIITWFRYMYCKFQYKLYLINRVSGKTLTTRLMIPLGTNSSPVEVSTELYKKCSNKNVDIEFKYFKLISFLKSLSQCRTWNVILCNRHIRNSWKVDSGCFWVLPFPLPIKLTAMISLRYCWKWR